MSIKVKCSCGASFAAKDSLAGKRVKCPKCSQPLTIPAPQSSPVESEYALEPAASRQAGTLPGNLGDPLADLLDEIGVQGAQTGPTCPNCDAPITSQSARLCINCGYNFETGELMRTVAYDEDDKYAGMSETEKMLAKAEKEIDDMPISGEGEDFGDGAGAYMVAGLVALVAITITGIALAVTMGMQQMAETGGSTNMAIAASAGLLLFTHVWMVIAAFMKDTTQGVICMFFPPYSFIFAILNKNWFAVAMMLMGGIVCAGASAVASMG